jgi:hypothetical protein
MLPFIWRYRWLVTKLQLGNFLSVYPASRTIQIVRMRHETGASWMLVPKLELGNQPQPVRPTAALPGASLPHLQPFNIPNLSHIRQSDMKKPFIRIMNLHS